MSEELNAFPVTSVSGDLSMVIVAFKKLTTWSSNFLHFSTLVLPTEKLKNPLLFVLYPTVMLLCQVK